MNVRQPDSHFYYSFSQSFAISSLKLIELPLGVTFLPVMILYALACSVPSADCSARDSRHYPWSLIGPYNYFSLVTQSCSYHTLVSPFLMWVLVTHVSSKHIFWCDGVHVFCVLCFWTCTSHLFCVITLVPCNILLFYKLHVGFCYSSACYRGCVFISVDSLFVVVAFSDNIPPVTYIKII